MNKAISLRDLFRPVKGRRKSFARNKSGSAAVEFSIVAPLFLAIMFSMFEVGWYFYANSVLDAATDKAGRMIRTGQVQENGSLTTPTERFNFLYSEICDVVDAFGTCATRLTMEVQTFATFAALAAATAPVTCADSPPDDIAAIPFVPGNELQIVRVRVCLIYDTINPTIGANLSEGDDGQRHLVSTMIFQNEPYEQGT